MTQTTFTSKVPGKLMIAGEYAVLEQYQRLVVTAVDRYVTAALKPSETSKLSLVGLGVEDAIWEYNGESVSIDADDKTVSFVKEALQTTFTYLKEQEIAITPFELKITSELDDVSGTKYGLGSSAAVTVAVVRVVLDYLLTEEADSELVFKLSAISHLKVQGNGSGADIAASTFGGWMEYASYQAEWLLEEIERAKTISRLVKRNWQYFKLETLELPKDFYLCVGWTGQAASTSEYVGKIQDFKHKDHQSYAEFMVQSSTAVQGILHGMKDSSTELIIEGIQMNRESLRVLGEKAGVEIETPELTTLCDLAEKLGGVAKPSGAGGGDCGIAFMPSLEKVAQLKEEWEKVGIKALDLQPQI